MTPAISVITPVFNGKNHIGKCISNVIKQDCRGIEHLIIDGGSTDGTVDIIREYARDYPHIRWISERDRGQSDAMNKGLYHANGSVIAFLNVDDWYEPGTLNTITELFQGLPENSMVVGNCALWDGEGKLLYVNKPSHLGFKAILSGKPFPVNPAAYFYHKTLHDKIGNYDVEEAYAMDLDFLLRAFQVANTVYVDEQFGNCLVCEGTKSYEDAKRGTQFARVKNLMKKYRERLDPLARAEATVNFGILELGRAGIQTLRRYHLYPEDFHSERTGEIMENIIIPPRFTLMILALVVIFVAAKIAIWYGLV